MKRLFKLAVLVLTAWLIPFSAFATTTRYYFTQTTESTVTPTQDAGWGYISEGSYKVLSATKGSSTLAFGTLIGALGAGSPSPKGWDRTYVSGDLGAGVSFSTSDTMKMQAIVVEGGNTDNIDTSYVAVKVVNSSGTVQATLKALGNYATNTEVPADGIGRNWTFLDGDTCDNSYTTSSGDRLIVEVGANAGGGGTTPEFQVWWGENGTDLPENQTAITGNGWFEISSTTGGGGGATPATLPMMGIGN